MGTRINQLPSGTLKASAYIPQDDGTTTEKISAGVLVPKKISISLPTASWTESSGVYSQTVTISGYTVTNNTKIDLQGDSTIFNQMLEDGTTKMYVSNNNGTLTAYALGEKPSINLTVQATVYEVLV